MKKYLLIRGLHWPLSSLFLLKILSFYLAGENLILSQVSIVLKGVKR